MRARNQLLEALPRNIAVPVDRGRLLHPEDVRERFFKQRHSLAWIRRNVAPEFRIRIGGTSVWFERDIEQWLESRRTGN